MNQHLVKTISISLCAALVLGGAGTAAYALSGSHGDDTQDTPAVVSAQRLQQTTAGDGAVSKDETVYVLAGADGSVQKIIVSDWLKNPAGSAQINDESQLTDIENVKGEETYSLGGGDAKVWDAAGNDIYYQGNLDKELPVGLTVSYQLNGQSIAPQDLAGQSGRVTIRFTYDNRQTQTVRIDGKTETLYVPFAMLTGVLLDNEIFTNVEVTNGKLVNDGDRTAVIGIAFPGLQTDLALDREKLEIPDYVEITADAQNFELGMTVTLATTEIFGQLDTQQLGDLDELTDSMDQLTDAMDALLDGSSQLYDGLCTLLDKSGELVSGIDQLAAGAKALKDGADTLNDGAAQLQTGAAQLATGLNTLCANNDTLNAGARQVFDTLLATANTQLAAAGLSLDELTVENYAAVLTAAIDSLDQEHVYQQARATVTAAVEAQRPAIQEQVTAAVQAQVAQQVTAAVEDSVAQQVIQAGANMSKETYDAAVAAGQVDQATQAKLTAAVDAQMASDAVQATIQAQTQTQMASDTVQATIQEQTDLQVEKAITEHMGDDEVQAQLAAASAGAQSLISLKEQLDSYNTFYQGLAAYTGGVATAAAGADQLKTGADQLKDGAAALDDGAAQLYAGLLQLQEGAPALVDGVTQLRDGSMELSDGLKQFNQEGIQKLADAVDGGLGSLTTRLRATADLAKSYQNFSGLSDGMDGQVKFIYRTESIETTQPDGE
jgi:putative membrane protein